MFVCYRAIGPSHNLHGAARLSCLGKQNPTYFSTSQGARFSHPKCGHTVVGVAVCVCVCVCVCMCISSIKTLKSAFLFFLFSSSLPSPLSLPPSLAHLHKLLSSLPPLSPPPSSTPSFLTFFTSLPPSSPISPTCLPPLPLPYHPISPFPPLTPSFLLPSLSPPSLP